MSRILTLQPNPAAGKDTYSDDANPNTNYGNATTMAVINVTSGGNQEMRTFIQFDISSLPAGIMRFNSAVLTLYGSGAVFSGNNIDIHRITAAWDQLTLTHNLQPAIGALIANVACADPFVVDIVSAVRNWYNGTWTNYGVRLSRAQEVTNLLNVYTSDELAETTKRPKLVISYDVQIVNINTIVEEFY